MKYTRTIPDGFAGIAGVAPALSGVEKAQENVDDVEGMVSLRSI
jgi:hypothetical protein